MTTNGSPHVTSVVATAPRSSSPTVGPTAAQYSAPPTPSLMSVSPTPVTAISLAPPKLDLAGIRAGDRNQIQMTLTTGGVPVDLTGVLLTAQARETVGTEVALTAVCTVTDPTHGVFTMRWPGNAVRDLVAGAPSWTGVWDLQMGTEDTAQTILAGSFTADNDVTRDA